MCKNDIHILLFILEFLIKVDINKFNDYMHNQFDVSRKIELVRQYNIYI